MNISQCWITILRVFVGLILFLAGIAKLTSFNAFVADVSSYQIIPIEMLKPVSYLLVSAEFTLGLGLVIGYFSRGASIVASILFLVFSVALAYILLQDLAVTDCGCGNILFSLLEMLGVSVSTPNWKMVFTDVILTGVCIGIASSSQRGYGLDSFLRQE
ncbi:DoxX family membrane protein [Candidatus Poribacteria bacterium]|nr:DoxX family membrane protein [Candidatus Poribacteria bacterium]